MDVAGNGRCGRWGRVRLTVAVRRGKAVHNKDGRAEIRNSATVNLDKPTRRAEKS